MEDINEHYKVGDLVKAVLLKLVTPLATHVHTLDLSVSGGQVWKVQERT